MLWFVVSVMLWSVCFAQEYACAYVFETQRGKGHGFFVREGYFVTDAALVDRLNAGELRVSEHVRLKAYVDRRFHVQPQLQGYSLLQTDAEREYIVEELGDSDLLDIGDELSIPGVGRGALLFKKQQFHEYAYPCLLSAIKTQDADSGKPVYNAGKQVVGLFLVYAGNHIIVPINSVKKIVHEALGERAKSPRFAVVSPEKEDSGVKPAVADGLVFDKVYASQNFLYHFASIDDLAFDRLGSLYVLDRVFRRVKKLDFSRVVHADILSQARARMAEKELAQASEGQQEQSADAQEEEVSSDSVPPEDADQQVEDSSQAAPVKDARVLQVGFGEPVSLTVTESGLLYVLDDAQSKIFVLNDQLEHVTAMAYSDLASQVRPVKIRAVRNEVFFISQDHRLYKLEEDARTGIMHAHPVSVSGESWASFSVVDVAHHDTALYLLSQETREVLRVDGQKITKVPLRAKFPVSVSVFGGQLYVFDRQSRKVEVYDGEGSFLRYWDAPFNTEWGRAEHLSVSASGVFAFGYREFEHVRFFNEYGEALHVTAGFSDSSFEMRAPVSVAAFGDGVELVNEEAQIARFSLEGARMLRLPVGVFDVRYRGVSRGADGRLFVSDVVHDKVFQCVDEFHCFEFGGPGRELGRFQGPVQMAVHGEFLYLLDKGNHRVVRFDTHARLSKVLLLQNPSGTLAVAQDIALDAKGWLYVLSENTVLCYDDQLELSRSFVVGSDNAQGAFAKGLAVLNDKVYVTDTYAHRVLVYTPEGEHVGSFGGLGDEVDQFFYPWDLLAYENALYVVDRGNHRALRYAAPKGQEEIEVEE